MEKAGIDGLKVSISLMAMNRSKQQLVLTILHVEKMTVVTEELVPRG